MFLSNRHVLRACCCHVTKMRVSNFLLVFFLFKSFSQAENITTEEGVLLLNGENFEQAINDNEFILVEFYAPWCGECKVLAPEYEKAASILLEKKSSVKLAKVDAYEEEDIAKKFGVRGYPTLKFFTNGNPIDYYAGRQASDIANWLLKKSGPLVTNLTSVDDAKTFVEGADLVVIGFFKDQNTDLAKAFFEVTTEADDDIYFGISENDEVFRNYNVQGESIMLFRKFDEGIVQYEDRAVGYFIKKFIKSNSLPLLVEFKFETSQKIFNSGTHSLLWLFLNKTDETYEKVTEVARSVVQSFREQVLFVIVDANDDQGLLKYYKLKKCDIPTARLYELTGDRRTYKPEFDHLTAKNLKQFVQDFLNGRLTPQPDQDFSQYGNEKSVEGLDNFDNVTTEVSEKSNCNRWSVQIAEKAGHNFACSNGHIFVFLLLINIIVLVTLL